MDSFKDESIIISDSEEDEPDNCVRELGFNSSLVYDDILIQSKCHPTIPSNGASNGVVKEKTGEIIILEDSEDDFEEKELWIDEDIDEGSLVVCTDTDKEKVSSGNNEKVICYTFDSDIIEVDLDDEIEEIPVVNGNHKESDPLAINADPDPGEHDSDENVEEASVGTGKDKSSSDSSGSENGVKLFACPHCSVKAKTLRGIKRHLSTKHEYRPYVCTICDYTGATSGHLRRHLQNIHMKKGTGPLKCKMCDKETSNVNVFFKHLLNNDHFKFVCINCNYLSCSYDDLKNHVKEKHPEMSKQEEEPLLIKKGKKKIVSFACSRCKYEAKNMNALKAHFKRLHRAAALQCRHCDFSSPEFKQLEAHVHSMHGNEKPFVCPHCNYGTVTFTKLKQHYAVCIKLKFLV